MKKFTQNFTKDIINAYKRVYKRGFCKKFRKTFYLAQFCLVMSTILCGCTMEGDTKEKEIVMQLSEKEGSISQQTAETVQEETVQEETVQKEIIQNANDIYVYVCGAVNCPGVYQTTEGSRLFEVVELAGGLSAEADETCLNLARAAEDGEQLVILTKEETAILQEKGIYNAGAAGGTGTGRAGEKKTDRPDSKLVNINTASISELTTVSGIGESRAQAIIAYREANGGFQTIEDIKKVDGIKDGLFSKIKDKITV